MSVISLIIALIFVGFALWLVQHLPLAAPIPTIIRGIVIFVLVLWLIDALFGLGTLGQLRIRR